ncbi:MAG: ferritin family protein [Planctomycetes bacterium]|nr:ferritin family protein [Planctomycetota bacterium]
MDATFNADELLEIAEQIERNGARFYRRAAENITKPKEHHLLLTLAAMEDEHEKTFAAIRAELDQEASDADFDLDDQAGMYLRAVADGQVFDRNADPAERLDGGESFEDILRAAVDLEKDSVVYYQGVRELVPKHLGREKVDRIINEEMQHIATLSKELAAVGGEG